MITTSLGDFSCFTGNPTKTKPYLVFLGTMGINCTYFDFYNVVKHINPHEFNVMCIDMLGAGFSSSPVNKKRNLENYTKELSTLIKHIDKTRCFLIAHSFNALYALNYMNLEPKKISGFIGIDPTAPEIMKHYKNELESNLKEAKSADKKMKNFELNPNLPSNLQKKAQALYTKLSGNSYEISELKESFKTLKQASKITVSEVVPTMSLLSTLNAAEYKKWGNPYFNDNQRSLEVVLHGHHFLQWVQPFAIAKLIESFVGSVENDL